MDGPGSDQRCLRTVLFVREQRVVKVVDSCRGDRRRGGEIARCLAQSGDVVRDELSRTPRRIVTRVVA
ncbi:MAG: hypothetical protein ACRDUV_04975 [Pseudonocardiaceae bacterium]